jgi:protein phosphatase
MEERLITVLLVLSVGVIAYVVGGRRASRDAPREATAKDAPKTKDALVEVAKPRVAATDLASRDDVKSHSSTAKLAKSSVPSSKVESSVSKPASAAPSSSGRLADLATSVPSLVTTLDYEEDDAVEPTMVGRAASAPPSKRRIVQPPVKRIIFDDGAATEEPPRAEPLFLVHATAQTDKGLRRKRNEDSLGVLESKNLFIVADGMGGYAGGDRASALSVDTMMDAFRSNTFEGPVHADIPREASDLARAIQMANATIEEEVQKRRALAGMGTTVCAAVFSPNKSRLYIGHVGDSRCYRLRDGLFKQITADHTMAELGVKGPEGQHLSRAVGIWPTVTIDIVMAVPRTGDAYLLCSDGLTKMLPDDIIGNVLRNEDDPKAAVERLIFFANARGGKDNITVILVRVVPPDWKPTASDPTPSGSPAPPAGEA